MSPFRSVLTFALLSVASAAPGGVINGDFSHPNPLFGYDVTGATVTEQPGAFAQLESNGTEFRVLSQTFAVPSTPTTLEFDFAFSTAVDPLGTLPLFLDSFFVFTESQTNFDYLDIMVVDAFLGTSVDPTDGFEGNPGYENHVPIDVGLDSRVTIPGFTPFSGGFETAGRIRVALPSNVLGDDVTLAFVLRDIDGFDSRAAVDNIALSANAIPEPASFAFWAFLTIGALNVRHRRMPA